MATRFRLPIEALTSRFNMSSFENLRSQSLTTRFPGVKPLSDFLDRKRFSRPADYSEAQARVTHNLGYYSGNYTVIFMILAIYAFLTNFLLFLDTLLIFGGRWAIGRLEGRDLDLGIFRATTSHLYAALFCVTFYLGILSNPFSTAIWLIGASTACILGHALLMEQSTESGFAEETESIMPQETV